MIWDYFNMFPLINLKTIYFNFKYLKFHDALRFPIFISKNVYLKKVGGIIQITGQLKKGMIRIGYGSVGIFDDKRSRSVWEVYGKVIFNGSASIGHGSKIVVGEEGELDIGNNFKITAETSIIAYHKVKFGTSCLLSWEILIMDTDFHTIRSVSGEILNDSKGIFVGNNVWIGSRCNILKGTIIPDNTVIAINSLVNSDLQVGNSIFGGIPAKCLKQGIKWEY